jgi:hypothetical protein
MRGDEECSKTIEWLCRANENDNYNRQEEPYAAPTTDEKYIPQKNAARSQGVPSRWSKWDENDARSL